MVFLHWFSLHTFIYIYACRFYVHLNRLAHTHSQSHTKCDLDNLLNSIISIKKINKYKNKQINARNQTNMKKINNVSREEKERAKKNGRSVNTQKMHTENKQTNTYTQHNKKTTNTFQTKMMN